jgi:hypothetical protein
MNDFDRELAECVGVAALKSKKIDRALIGSCYQQVAALTGGVEDAAVTEKWIDLITSRLVGMRINGKNSKQIAEAVFEKIAKF